MANDPVPAITEAEATGETAEIFADLRDTLGVNVVNLVWRHIATFPGALAWAWATLRPIYVSGAVGLEARRLRSELVTPALSVWPGSALRCVEVDATSEATIRRVLASYNRSNALNLVALSALVRHIDGAPFSATASGVAPASPPERAVEGSMPRLLALDEVTKDTADLILKINLLADRHHGRIVASMYRHLAHWPGFLALCYAQLAPLAADGSIGHMIESALTLADHAGARLQGQLTATPRPENVANIRQASVEFIEQAISKMVPIAKLIEASLAT